MTFLYLIVAVLFAFLLAIWQYGFRKRKFQKLPWGLLVLRFFSLLALLLLLINPEWGRASLSVHKPSLVIAVDNSASMVSMKTDEFVKNMLHTIRENKKLQDKFEVTYFCFGTNVRLLDSLDFSDSHTDIFQLLHQLESLYKEPKIPVLLFTDGNSTLGSNYEFYPPKNTIYPIVVGDTTRYKDLKITKINVNPYAFIENKFPVELFALYEGEESVTTYLSIYQNRQQLFRQKISFGPDKRSQSLSILLPAEKLGRHYYTAVLQPIKNEKNTQNNRRDFSVEIIDQQTKVLLVSSFYHPDLGTLKKSIESNKQRKVTLEISKNEAVNLSQYQLLIIYQPISELTAVFEAMQRQNTNAFIITGTKTDWDFLNKSQTGFTKNATQLKENHLPFYNPDFPEYVTKDIGFKDLPPLKDLFGTLQFKTPYQTLLYQKTGSVITQNPLLATYEENGSKKAVLFGEDLWRWRMFHKIEHENYTGFDEFIGAIVQFLATDKERKQLYLDYNKLCFSNDIQVIKVRYLDKNHQLDMRASLWMYITDKQKNKTEKIPFSLKGESYEVVLENLAPGTYTFQVTVDGQEAKAYGSFKILDYHIEQQFTTANVEKLTKLANNSGGILGYADKYGEILQTLIDNPNYQPVQKSKKIRTPLIDWWWLLAIIIVSLSAEWFIRKYRGWV